MNSVMLIEKPANRDLRAAIWRKGTDLGLAWYVFGDERQKRLHNERTGTSASLAYQKLMAADLFGSIAGGEFVAFGFRTAPSVSDGPVMIPADVFDAPMTDDWGEATVLASGWRYERVTVLTLEEFQQLLTDLHVAPAPDQASGVQKKEGNPQGRKSGRRDTYDLCSKVFDFWAENEPGLLELSAEQLEPRFKQDYDAIHGSIAKLTPAPKVRTLRYKLEEYRSANISRNRQE